MKHDREMRCSRMLYRPASTNCIPAVKRGCHSEVTRLSGSWSVSTVSFAVDLTRSDSAMEHEARYPDCETVCNKSKSCCATEKTAGGQVRRIPPQQPLLARSRRSRRPRPAAGHHTRGQGSPQDLPPRLGRLRKQELQQPSVPCGSERPRQQISST